MKQLLIPLICAGLCVGTGHAQTLVDDFENSGRQWDEISCSSFIVNNPYQTGLNVSCKCLELLRTPGCEDWSGAITHFTTPVTGYNYVHALMYRNNDGMPNLKITDNGTDLDMAPMTTIVANEWQDVVFDISSKPQADFVFFMADRNELTADAVVLVDDIIFSNDATPRTEPNTACTPVAPVVPGDYTLVWNADFTSASLPANWNVEVRNDGGGNNEIQYYCAKGVSVGTDPQEGKHCLILTATKEDYMDKKCTSGRVNTQGHTYFQYGMIEARIWFPRTANGLWPAFWMMGNDIPQVGWPACGETDIIELGNSNGFNGRQDRYFNGASHWGPDWQTHYQYANDITNSYSVEDGFHIFTCVWTPEKVAMYLDMGTHPNANPYYEMAITPSTASDAPGTYFHKPNHILLNLAIGGNFPGIYNIDGITALNNGPCSMYIDWVRIYQRGDENQSFHSDVPSEAIEPTTPQGIESIQPSDISIQKVLRNGQLLIIRGEKIYTTTGQSVQ